MEKEKNTRKENQSDREPSKNLISEDLDWDNTIRKLKKNEDDITGLAVTTYVPVAENLATSGEPCQSTDFLSESLVQEELATLAAQRLKIEAKLKRIELKNKLVEAEIQANIAKKHKNEKKVADRRSKLLSDTQTSLESSTINKSVAGSLKDKSETGKSKLISLQPKLVDPVQLRNELIQKELAILNEEHMKNEAKLKCTELKNRLIVTEIEETVAKKAKYEAKSKRIKSKYLHLSKGYKTKRSSFETNGNANFANDLINSANLQSNNVKVVYLGSRIIS